MNRRNLLLALAAAGLAACAPLGAAAAPFEPTRFSVEVRGEGPDVILIPGLTAGRDVWTATARAIPGYRYHLVQVSGFAGEPVRGNAEGPVVEPLADELIRYIEDRRLRRPAIVGHSMGGTLAMMIGARRPDLPGRIMVVDMLPAPAALLGSSADGLGPLADSLRDFAATPGGQRLFASLLGSFSPPNSSNRRSDPDVVGRAMHELSRIDLGGDLARIRAPLTIVYAARDARARPIADRDYAAAYAQARNPRLVRIDRSGHMIMFDQPHRLREEIEAFLRD